MNESEVCIRLRHAVNPFPSLIRYLHDSKQTKELRSDGMKLARAAEQSDNYLLGTFNASSSVPTLFVV
jgi:hypothetical protein